MSFKNQVYNLMKDWCDELLKTQLSFSDPLLDGALLCPGCAVVHGRCADMVLPLVLLYKETGEWRTKKTKPTQYYGSSCKVRIGRSW